MYTLEITGRPIVVINAGSRDQAEAVFNSDWFRRELKVFETEDGEELWNGSDELSARPALPEEAAKFEAHHARALHNNDAEHGAPYAVFLIPVTDVTDELD